MSLLQQGPHRGGAAPRRIAPGIDGGDLGRSRDARRRQLCSFGAGARRDRDVFGAGGGITPPKPATYLEELSWKSMRPPKCRGKRSASSTVRKVSRARSTNC